MKKKKKNRKPEPLIEAMGKALHALRPWHRAILRQQMRGQLMGLKRLIELIG